MRALRRAWLVGCVIHPALGVAGEPPMSATWREEGADRSYWCHCHQARTDRIAGASRPDRATTLNLAPEIRAKATTLHGPQLSPSPSSGAQPWAT